MNFGDNVDYNNKGRGKTLVHSMQQHLDDTNLLRKN